MTAVAPSWLNLGLFIYPETKLLDKENPACSDFLLPPTPEERNDLQRQACLQFTVSLK